MVLWCMVLSKQLKLFELITLKHKKSPQIAHIFPLLQDNLLEIFKYTTEENGKMNQCYSFYLLIYLLNEVWKCIVILTAVNIKFFHNIVQLGLCYNSWVAL